MTKRSNTDTLRTLARAWRWARRARRAWQAVGR